MINSNINEILSLRGYAISEHKGNGILVAEKQIIIPEKEILMQDQSRGMVWINTNGIIPTDNAFSLKGGRMM